MGFEHSPIDFVIKPLWSPRVLVARIHALLRRSRAHVRCGGTSQSCASAFCSSILRAPFARSTKKRSRLSSNEFDLLLQLATIPGEILAARNALPAALSPRIRRLLIACSTCASPTSKASRKVRRYSASPSASRPWGHGYLFVADGSVSDGTLHFLQPYLLIVATVAVASWAQGKLWDVFCRAGK